MDAETNQDRTDPTDLVQPRPRITGEKVRRLREEQGTSTDDLISGMNKLGYNWNRTTLFNIEHDMRRLQANEAIDILIVMGLDPYLDMPRLMCTEKRILARRLRETHHGETGRLMRAVRAYMSSLTAYARILDELKTEERCDVRQIETEIDLMKAGHDTTVKIVAAELGAPASTVRRRDGDE